MYDEEWNYGSFSLNKGFSTEGEFSGVTSTYPVNVIPLDQCGNVQRLNSLALLKVDAEGFDAQVLRGARQTITRLLPAIFIERQAHTQDEILSVLDELQYQAFWFVSERFQPDNFNHTARFGQGIDVNFLCFPHEIAPQQNVAAIEHLIDYLPPFHADDTEIPLVIKAKL